MSSLPSKKKRISNNQDAEPHRTSQEAVDTYLATVQIFGGLISEVRELSKKKPDATLNKGKVRIINRVLTDLQIVLDREPEKKFLDLLDDEELPQTSDAVLIMVQYETALSAFPDRYRKYVQTGTDEYGRPVRALFWITDDFDFDNP
ncbi:MAG: hypothetical protein E5X80_28465 [Mesorhizobium sp.]|uniref:hypothetical protein n=1 Tax=Mesorhizobium sp. TaxID=1871066 RepID=UPI0012287516|nr:hypothetical protein [Mesorhizobium sp.]TIO48346.1 MAG: hypothetical protein E5X78_29640 [Mesorhizobium sp.]TIO57422.1 MAG: hypothetical protein E5X79_26125 [Mesorhizobium sp.]TJV58365.1 MAG: hypothetical protein E5X80_28465 [Mesorhizobium sp.]